MKRVRDEEEEEECILCCDSTHPLDHDMTCCGQHTHLKCLLQVRKPECPFCRAPLSSSSSLNEHHLKHIEEHQAEDQREREQEFFAALRRARAYTPGSPQFTRLVNLVTQHYSIPQMLSFQSKRHFILAAHDVLHPLLNDDEEEDIACERLCKVLELIYMLIVQKHPCGDENGLPPVEMGELRNHFMHVVNSMHRALRDQVAPEIILHMSVEAYPFIPPMLLQVAFSTAVFHLTAYGLLVSAFSDE